LGCEWRSTGALAPSPVRPMEGLGAEPIGTYHGDIDGASPRDVTRSCTDVPFLVLFLGALGCLGATVLYADQHGDLGSLAALPDFQGNTCGEGGHGHFLYFCRSETTGHLDLEHPICVDVCPASNSTKSKCWEEQARRLKSKKDGEGGSETTATQQLVASEDGSATASESAGSWKLTQDYASYGVGGIFCMPSTEDKASVMSFFSGSDVMVHIAKTAEVFTAWPLLLFCTVLACILSCSFVFLLEGFAYYMMWGGFLVFIALPLGIGAMVIYGSLSPDGHIEKLPSDGDDQTYLIVGALLILTSLCIAALGLSKRTKLNKAVAVTVMACEAITQLPTLLLEPWIASITKVLVFAPMLSGFLLLLSCGRTKDTSPDDWSTQPFFQFNTLEYFLIAFYLFMMVWVNEYLLAASRFAVSYIVEVWFYVNKITQEPIGIAGVLKGHLVATFYHTGTLALGSMVIAFVRPIRVLGEACGVDALQYLSKNAFVDVAINSVGFFRGAKHAHQVLKYTATPSAFLHGTTWFVQVAGVGSVSTCTAAAIWALTTRLPKFTDSAQKTFVQDPLYLCGVAALIGVVVSVPFMHVFDTVSDTALYCISNHEWRKPKPEPPKKSFCWNPFQRWQKEEARGLLAGPSRSSCCLINN